MGQKSSDVFKPMTFWGLLQQPIEYSEEKKKVLIPIIQRPYTQGGRADDEGIREKGKRFCTFLVSKLKSGGQADVNIVYGSEKNHKIELLDGQQRMTTLYLLYWYVGNKVLEIAGQNVLKENRNVFHDFTYETRTTTRRFFKALVDEDLVRIPGMDRKAKEIENQGWFSPLWKNDQSVKSALGMLQLIENAFDDRDNVLPYGEYWEKMTSCDEKVCPFVFSYTILNDLNQSDDLYIKMNARGKQLTSFENLKAGISKIATDKKWEETVALKDRFLQKMDNGWTDIFWEMRDRTAKIDINIQAIMASCMIFHYAATKKDAEKVRVLFNNILSLDHTDYSEQEAFESLIHYFSSLEKAFRSGFFKGEFNLRYSMLTRLHHHCSIDRILKDACLKGLTDSDGKQMYNLNWPTLAYLKAVLLFFSNVRSPKERAFQQWMRVIRNILENTTVDSYERFVSMDNLMEELAGGCSDIYGFLSKTPVKSQVASTQVQEEKIKAVYRLDTSNDTFKDPSDNTHISANDKIISELEDTYIGHGHLSFFLDCAGIRSSKDTFDYELFEKYKVTANTYLIEDFSDGFRAALFTSKDNLFYTYWHSYLYALEEHKYCIGEKGELLSMIQKKHHCYQYIKDLVIRLADNYDNDLSRLLQDFDCSVLPGWMQKIIQKPTLLTKYCTSKYITVGGTSKHPHCYLLKAKRASDSSKWKKIQ